MLKERGIFVQSAVSLERQHLAKRYVVRGLESGGAVGDLGRYVTFARPDGRPVECLYPVEAIGVNGLHAVVVAAVLVRIEMLRKGRTYELLVTQHGPSDPLDEKNPALETKVLFRGIHGRLELDLAEKDKSQASAVAPTFYSLAGEKVLIPKRFRAVVQAITKAVNCTGCSHSHFVRVRHEGEAGAAVSTAATQASEKPQSAASVA